MVNEIQQYIKTWEGRCYPNGIPDEVPVEINDLCPSYKKIAMTILKNDYSLKTLGFTPKPSGYYSELKKIELFKRDKLPIQLKLF